MTKPKILLTGATGAVGSEILQQLAQNNQLSQVRVFSRRSKANEKKLKKYKDEIEVFWADLSDKNAVAQACKDVDIVIHLAAIIPPVSEEKKNMAWNINVEGTRNIVEGIKLNAPSAFLMFSSSVVVYGDRIQNPNIKVGDRLDTQNNDNYGYSKIEAEKIRQRWGVWTTA